MTTKKQTKRALAPKIDEISERLKLFDADTVYSLTPRGKQWLRDHPAERPRTVCADCAHVHDTYDSYDEELVWECTATPLWWSPVTGEPTWALCTNVNDGECSKWEAKPGPLPKETALFPEDLFPGGLVAPPAPEMFPQPRPVWPVGVALTAAVLLAAFGGYVWFVSQNGWRWW